MSASKTKPEESKKAFLNDSSTELPLTNSVSWDSFKSGELIYSSEDEEVDGDSTFLKHYGNYIINTDNFQELLETYALCKVRYSSLQIVKKMGTKQSVGAKWYFRCINELRASRQSSQPLPISSKSGKIDQIDRASVVGCRAVGKGRTAAEKCLSFLGLAPVYTWHKHTKVIQEQVKNLTETDFIQTGCFTTEATKKKQPEKLKIVRIKNWKKWEKMYMSVLASIVRGALFDGFNPTHDVTINPN